jgi:mannonate dehydratase
MELVNKIAKDPHFTMPGWEPERLENITNLFEAYRPVTEEDLFDHLQYFLEAIIPVAEENDIKMAIHPDDPPWSVFGLPRIVTNQENIRHILQLVDSPYNGVTLCSGALGSRRSNDVIAMVREFAD